MNPMRSILWGSLVAIGVLVALLVWNQSPPGGGSPREALLVYCAAGLKPAVEAAAKDYEREQRVPVQLQYGGSGTLLNNLKVARRGDVFIPADGGFVDLGRSQGLLAEVLPVARMTALIAVPRAIRRVFGPSGISRGTGCG